MLDVAVDGLKSAARDFYTMTKIKIVLYDENRRNLYSYPETMCTFCEMIRSVPKLCKECLKCDNIGFDICEKTRKPYIYKCHMNIVEAIAPIIENDVLIGYMMLGQVSPPDSLDEICKKASETALKYNLDKELLLKSTKSIRAADNDFIISAVNMMSMCACYLYVNKIITNKTDIISCQLTDYINAHLADRLTVAELCKTFYLSRSRLYYISNKAFNMGISEYIRKTRLEKAKELLLQTEKKVYQIADETGFDDPNYFIRIFKQYMGVTPYKYRKSKG